MFTSFEGQYRQRPVQSLRGASKTEDKNHLLQRTQTERNNREELRRKQKSSILIQAYYRSYAVRKRQIIKWRELFDQIVKSRSKTGISATHLRSVTIYLCHIFDEKQDGERLVSICQRYLSLSTSGQLHISPGTHQSMTDVHQLRRLLVLCLRYLTHISTTTQPIAVPMRMLEVFTSPSVLSGMSPQAAHEAIGLIYLHIVQHGYFECMHCLLDNKVPNSIDKTSTPPTPMAASIFDLIMKPLGFANRFSKSSCILRCLCRTILGCPYSPQISLFLIPAMACGRYPFPLVELIQALLPSRLVMNNPGGTDTAPQSGSKRHRGCSDVIRWSPWLLHSVLVISENKLEGLSRRDKVDYIGVLQHLIPHLPPPPQLQSDIDSDDSDESDHDMEVEGVVTLEHIRPECLRCLENTSLVQCLVLSINQQPSPQLCTAVCVICSTLLSDQLIPVHKSRLLYSLAFSSPFLRYLWKSCATSHIVTATGSKTPLLYLLSTGLPMSRHHMDTIHPLLSVFCSLFTHSLLTLDDQEFYSTEKRATSMPFSMAELVKMSMMLRDACIGIVELAHPDSKHVVDEDYQNFLESQDIPTYNHKSNALTAKWAYLFKVISGLVRHLYNRDVRRQFCPHQHWLSKQITIQYERPTQMYRAQNAMFVRRRFGPGTLRSTVRTPDEEDGPPLSNKEIRKLVVLTEIPFVVPFQERVRVLQKLITDDKELSQGDIDLGPYAGGSSSIHVMVRRNYIYEDAFDKLSPENEPNLKLRMRVQLINTAGLEEAGVDGGGLFREFLNELLKTGYDPNRGFFQNTTDHQLYPNPQAQLLNADYTKHYYFLGRMLGKALYENMLVELPFANFFLSKILSRHGANLDIHHLASLDPEMYKQLISLKTYEGDVSDLALDFTIVRNDFGQTKVAELKPGGSNMAVTNENRIEYVHLMADYFLNKQIRQHSSAFRQGMADVIDLDWLSMFDHHELQVLISGAHIPIDIDDLRRHTNYSGGYTSDHPVISIFWKVVSAFSDDECRQLLKFVTSCSRPPLLGFKDLFPAFCVHHAGHEADRLPTASTCMNLLKLPEFKDEGTLRSKLVYAIESGAGFELS